MSFPILGFYESEELTARRLATGALGTTAFGLSLRDTSLVITFFAFLTCIPPAFMGLGGYQTGMRQMIQARYSFGYDP